MERVEMGWEGKRRENANMTAERGGGNMDIRWKMVYI
jgi:hypothetical protein